MDNLWLKVENIVENIVEKGEIACAEQFLFLSLCFQKAVCCRGEQFLLLSQCFPLLVIGYPFNYRDFPLFDKICSKSSAAELLYEGKG